VVPVFGTREPNPEKILPVRKQQAINQQINDGLLTALMRK